MPEFTRCPFLAFACSHLSAELLYAAELVVLQPRYDCRVFAFCDHETLRGMASELLGATQERSA